MTAQLEPSIVRIHTVDGKTVGAGFLVTERQVLTCAHVVTAALDLPDDTTERPQAEVHLDFPLVAPEHILIARVSHWRPAIDITVLELSSDLPAGVRPVRLLTTSNLWGHAFRAFGFPVGYEQGVWTSGVLRGRQADGWLQIEDTTETGYLIAPGFSGGPVWDDVLGGVVGMIVAADTDEKIKAAFMILADVLIEVWSGLAREMAYKVNELRQATAELTFKGTPAQFWAVAHDLNSRLQKRIYVIAPQADNNLVYVRFGKGEMEPSEIVRQTVYFGQIMARSMPGGRTALRMWFEDEGKSINKAKHWWDLLVERMENDGWLMAQDGEGNTGKADAPEPRRRRNYSGNYVLFERVLNVSLSNVPNILQDTGLSPPHSQRDYSMQIQRNVVTVRGPENSKPIAEIRLLPITPTRTRVTVVMHPWDHSGPDLAATPLPSDYRRQDEIFLCGVIEHLIEVMDGEQAAEEYVQGIVLFHETEMDANPTPTQENAGRAGASVVSPHDSTAALRMARRALAILEEQAAGYTALTIPPHLKIELEEKRREVAELEARLNGAVTAPSPAPVAPPPAQSITVIGDGNVIGNQSRSTVQKGDIHAQTIIADDVAHDAQFPAGKPPVAREEVQPGPAAPLPNVLNPFLDRGCINDPTHFFDRRRILRELRQMLAAGNSISLVGGQEIGKSSLLVHLYQTRAEWLPDITVIYLDLQGMVNEKDFCAEVLEGLGQEPEGGLRRFKRVLRRSRTLLLLDEVEKLTDPAFSSRLHDLLRALAQKPSLTLAVASHSPLVEVFPPTSSTSPFHNIFTEKRLGPFDPSDARAFLEQRLATTGVTFTPEEQQQLVIASGGHPAHLQRRAYDLFEQKRR